MAGWKVYVCTNKYCRYEFDEKRESKKSDYISINDRDFECPKCGKPARYFDEVTED